MNPLYGLGGRTGRSGGGRDAGSRGRRGALPILEVLGPREAITREEAAATVTTRPVLNTERANGGDRRPRLAPLPGPASDGAVSPGPLHGRTHPPPHTHAHPEVDGDPLTGKSEEGVFVLASLGLLRLGGRRSPPGWRRRLPPCFLPSRCHPGFSGAGGATIRPRLSSRLRAAAAHRRLPSPPLAQRRLPVLVPDGDPPTGPLHPVIRQAPRTRHIQNQTHEFLLPCSQKVGAIGQPTGPPSQISGRPFIHVRVDSFAHQAPVG